MAWHRAHLRCCWACGCEDARRRTRRAASPSLRWGEDVGPGCSLLLMLLATMLLLAVLMDSATASASACSTLAFFFFCCRFSSSSSSASPPSSRDWLVAPPSDVRLVPRLALLRAVRLLRSACARHGSPARVARGPSEGGGVRCVAHRVARVVDGRKEWSGGGVEMGMRSCVGYVPSRGQQREHMALVHARRQL